MAGDEDEARALEPLTNMAVGGALFVCTGADAYRSRTNIY